MDARTSPPSGEQTPDTTLLRAIQQGSHPAFTQLVERYALRFYRLAFRYTGQRESAEDIIQRSFLKLWQDPGLWKEGKAARFSTWFSRIIINAAYDEQRKKKPFLLLEIDEQANEDSSSHAESSLISAQEKVQLEYAIRTLPERQQAALNLCFYEDRSYREAADIMQSSPKAIESLLMRAKASLKRHLLRPDAAIMPPNNANLRKEI